MLTVRHCCLPRASHYLTPKRQFITKKKLVLFTTHTLQNQRIGDDSTNMVYDVLKFCLKEKSFE